MGGEFDYITTENGNRVAIALDENGNTFMLDGAGNMYYDTGDARFGIYIVSASADREGSSMRVKEGCMLMSCWAVGRGLVLP